MNYKSQYNAQHYDRVRLQIRREIRDKLAELAKQNQMSISRLILEAMEDVYNLDLHTPRH